MKENQLKSHRRKRRQRTLRTKLRRVGDRPRLSIFRSCKHISAQIIDDGAGKTLASVSSTAKSLADQLNGKNKTQRAAIIGAEVAKKAIDAGVTEVVFDRGFTKYHGRVKALADAARESGLKF